MTVYRWTAVYLVCSLLLNIDSIYGCGSCPRCRKTVKTNEACDGSYPCYETVITWVSDGPFLLIPQTEESGLVNHFSLISDNGRRFAINEARKAIEFYLSKYGFDFTHLRDDEVLYGVHTNGDGVLFQAAEVGGSVSRFRPYMASRGDEAQVLNWDLSDFGWFLVFEDDVQATGNYNRIIPKNSMILYGTYIIQPCQRNGYFKACKNILNPDDPYTPIDIHYNSIDYVTLREEPNVFQDINCELYSRIFGVGQARGYGPIRPGTADTVDVRLVHTYPPIK